MKLIVFSAIFFVLIIKSYSLKILALLPVASKSHWIIGHEIVKSLVDAGHEATVLTPFPMENPIKNYEEIDISKMTKLFDLGN